MGFRLVIFFIFMLNYSIAQVQGFTDIQQKTDVTAANILVQALDNIANLEVTIIDVTYLPEGVNRRHFHSAAVTFYILSGTPVF